jgi:hypothetical protein
VVEVEVQMIYSILYVKEEDERTRHCIDSLEDYLKLVLR